MRGIRAFLIIAGVAALGLGAAETQKFVGANDCKKCHMKQMKSWKETTHAKAFDVLKAGEAADAKKKLNLDAAKDFTKDETCLACHATGHGKPGGPLEGVQCEACHGAGAGYMEYKKAHKDDYKTEDAVKAGLVAGGVETCKNCHVGADAKAHPQAALDAAAKLGDKSAIHEKKK